MVQAVPSPLSFFSHREVGTFIRPAITMVSIERSFATAKESNLFYNSRQLPGYGHIEDERQFL